MPARVLIVGAGQIGALYDSPGPGPALTYAHGVLRNPGLELAGFVEVDPQRGQAACQRWGGSWFPDLKSAWSCGNIDIVCLAVPDPSHEPVLRQLAAYPFRVLLAEKPFTTCPNQAQACLELFAERQTPVLINYSRRYVPAFTLLAQRIAAGEFGPLLCATGYYGKGSVHNGSHMVNLLLYLFGSLRFQSRLDILQDYRAEDPTATVLLKAGATQSPVVLQVVDSRCVSLFELDLLFARQRIRMTQSGQYLEHFAVAQNALFPDYRQYAPGPTEETGLFQAMSHLLDQALNVLQGGPEPEADRRDAITTLELCRSFSQ